jgi:hypothetical protein
MNRFRSVALYSSSVSLMVVALSGCAVRPSVTYTKITPHTDVSTLTDSYFLQSSMVTIKAADTAKSAADPAQADVQVTSTPIEYPDLKIGITSNRSWFGAVTTVVNFTKIDNTALVKEVGSEISDKRVDTIKTIGSIITTGLGIVGFEAVTELGPSKLPWTTKTYKEIAENQAVADAGKPMQLHDGVTMTLGALPPDAKPIDTLPTKSNAFLYAACRDATIEFTFVTDDPKDKNKKVESKHFTTLKIADPRYYQLVAFPLKGKITTHPECGVSVTTDKDTSVSTGTDIANALAAQGKAIKDAIDSSKKTPAAK